MAKKQKKRKNQPIGKNLRKHAVDLVDDAFGIVDAVGNPARMYKVVRRTLRKRPILTAVAALVTATALWAKRRVAVDDDAEVPAPA